jgi:hypothetical protein
VRGGHRVHVVALAAGGLLTVEALAVPAREAALAERLYRGERHIALAEDFIGTIGEAAERLGARLGIRDGGEVVRQLVARAVVLVVAARPPRISRDLRRGRIRCLGGRSTGAAGEEQ